MNIDQHLVSHLPYLAAVYRHKSFTHAAASLFVSQTAISYQIKKLEGKLDCQLVIRQPGSRLRFTADGDALVKAYLHCEKLLSVAVEGLNHKEGQGILRLSTPVDFGSMVMPRVIAQVMQVAPKMKIELHSGDENVSLENGIWDMTIRSRLKPLKSALYSSPILLVVGSEYYSTNDKEPKNLRDLCQHTILLRQNSNNKSWKKLVGHPASFSSTLTFGTTLGMREAARENLGVALLPEFVVKDELKSGELVQLLPRSTEKLNVYFDLMKIDAVQTNSYEALLRDAFTSSSLLDQ